MKLVTYSDHGDIKLGAIKGDGVIDLRKRIPSLPGEMIALIDKWDDVRSRVQELVEESEADAALADVRLMAPVTRPGKIIGIGLNYADHIKETGQQTPNHQVWFSKPSPRSTVPSIRLNCRSLRR